MSLADVADWARANQANLYVLVPALIFVLALWAALASSKFSGGRIGWTFLCFIYIDLHWFMDDTRIVSGLPIGAVIVLLIALFGPKPRQPERLRTTLLDS
jgi:hypothetical protein